RMAAAGGGCRGVKMSRLSGGNARFQGLNARSNVVGSFSVKRSSPVPRPDAALIAVACCGIFLILAPAHSAAPVGQPAGLEIEDFSYLDTSGEPTNQAAEHQVRLRALISALKHDVEADGRYRLLPSSCAPPCASQGPVTSERLDAASEAGANILIIGAIQKMSTLVQ